MGNPYDKVAPQFEDYQVNCAKEEALQDYLATSDIIEDVLNADDESVAIKLTQFIILKNKGENEEANLMFDDFIKALSKENNDFSEQAYDALLREHNENLAANAEQWQENNRAVVG